MEKKDVKANSYQEEEFSGLSCAITFFHESEEVLQLIDHVKIQDSSQERNYQRFTAILQKYRENPNYLDDYLDEMLERLINIALRSNQEMGVKHEAFKYLRIVISIRGYKIVARRLQRNTSEFVPVLTLLESEESKDHKNLDTRFCLLFLLAVIMMMPFPLSEFDQPGDSAMVQEDMDIGKGISLKFHSSIARVLRILKDSVVDRSFPTLTSFLAARFLTRADVKDKLLGPFMKWLLATDKSCVSETLCCLAGIFKQGTQSDLLLYCSDVIKFIKDTDFINNSDIQLRKYALKALQRVGLILLKERNGSWHYQLKLKPLLGSLESYNAEKDVSPKDEKLRDNDDDDYNISDIVAVENIIDDLVEGLKDSATIVRYSAAKGIARITFKLSRYLGRKVVISVLELLTPQNTDKAWHGACYALAELARRGLLLPEQLNDTIPRLLEALTYDKPRGYSSFGEHVRDAACYVAWAFARAYKTSDIEPFAHLLAPQLLAVAIFDREVHVRRAAAAAFQETVGRHNIFPHGQTITTIADFDGVGTLPKAFAISDYVAQYNEYSIPLLDHLITHKLGHWDPEVRLLTVTALRKLTQKSPAYVKSTVFPKLLHMTKSPDLNVRSGAIMAIGETVSSSTAVDLSFELFVETFDPCYLQVLMEIFNMQKYVEKTLNESMRIAWAYMIERLANTRMQFPKKMIQQWRVFLEENLSNENESVCSQSCSALRTLYCTYSKTCYSTEEPIVKKYSSVVLHPKDEKECSAAMMVIGLLPKSLLMEDLECTLNALTAPKDSVNCRRDSLIALAALCETVGMVQVLQTISPEILFKCFFDGLKDYTLSKLGDIGSYVREAALTAMKSVVCLMSESCPKFLTATLVVKVVCEILMQAVEKIDRVRVCAGKALTSVLYCKVPVPHIPYVSKLTEVFPPESDENFINWNSASDTFPRFAELLNIPEYMYSILTGFILNIGDATESSMRVSRTSFLELLNSWNNDKDKLMLLCVTIVKIFQDHLREDRVMVPMIIFLDQIIGSGCIDPVIYDPSETFATDILYLMETDSVSCKNLKKLNMMLSVACHLVAVGDFVSKQALGLITFFLCYPAVWLRRSAAARMFESLTVYGTSLNFSADDLDKISKSLTSATDLNRKQSCVLRNEICVSLDLPRRCWCSSKVK